MPNTSEKPIELINKWEVVNKLIQLENNYQFYKEQWDADVLYRGICELEIGIGKTPGVTVQQWIPVSEPPKKNGYYLCWILFSAVGERKEYRQKILFWEDNIWLESARSFSKAYPLYWMPLPEPPKGV